MKQIESGSALSQWQTQLGALGLDPTTAGDPASVVERTRLQQLPLPDLRWPQRAPLRPRGSMVRWGLPCALIAVMTAVLWPSSKETLRPKGGSNVRLYWERAGTVSEWTPATTLNDGDRVRAEIDAGQAATAYWFVVDENGKQLVEKDFVQDTALSLRPGTATPFSKSLQIVGPSVGEILHVVVCDKPQALKDVSLGELARQTGCVDKIFPLRGH